MKKSLSASLILLTLAIPSTVLALAPGEGIVLDRNTGDYIITYANPVGRLKQSRFVPSTKIDPTLSSRFENKQGLIHYRYSIKNGSRGKQPLIGLIFDPVSSVHSKVAPPGTEKEYVEAVQQLANDLVRLEKYVNEPNRAIEAPIGWNCEIFPNGQTVRSNFRVACSFDDLDEEKHNGLQVGSSVSGFGFYSLDLPGIGIAQLDGFGDMGPSFVDEGPDGEVSDQLDALVKNDNVPRNAAVPTIAVPILFDAAVLLDRIRTHVAAWTGKQLLDPAFATQLDRTMVAAANAFRNNQPKIGREHIESVRKLLEREHRFLDHDDEDNEDTPEHKHATRNSIDRLAARVLDFDLRYVLKRMEHEHGERGRKKEQERK